MALPITSRVYYITVDIMAMKLAYLGASFSELVEAGDLDVMEFGSRETTGLVCLWKTTSRWVSTSRVFVTIKTVSLTNGLFIKQL